jgi:hypothetical protein
VKNIEDQSQTSVIAEPSDSRIPFLQWRAGARTITIPVRMTRRRAGTILVNPLRRDDSGLFCRPTSDLLEHLCV